MHSHKIAGQKGFTLIEITIILLVLVILGAILLPVIERFVDLARVARAHEDVGTIASAIILALYDTGEQYFLQQGNGSYNGGPFAGPPDYDPLNQNRVRMLISDGNGPVPAPGAPMSAWSWGPLITPCFAPSYPSYNCDVDTFENHLVTNRPGGLASNRYRTPPDLGNGPIGWRGAYLTAPILPDSWGSYYAANVEFLDPKNVNCGGPCSNMDVVVFSAGPNQQIETDYQKDGLVARGDDIICLISGFSQ